MNDDELHQLLRRHPASLTLPSAFEREVWSRIEADEGQSASSLLAELVWRMLNWLGRPAVAVATIAIFAFVGAGAGVVMLKMVESQHGELAYLETVNPMVRAHTEMEP